MAPLVYVVDDERIITTTVVAILKSSGFEVVGFSNPLKALRAAATILPDILLSDVFMPEMNGVELGIQFRTSM